MEAEGGEEERRDGAEVHHEARHHVHSRADVRGGHLATERRASNKGSRRFHNHGEGPFSWLKVSTFKTFLRHFAKHFLTHRKLM